MLPSVFLQQRRAFSWWILPITIQLWTITGFAATVDLAMTIRHTAGIQASTPLSPPHFAIHHRLNINHYRQPQDGQDIRPAIQRALNKAHAGDDIYFPDGRYQLNSTWQGDKHTSIRLRSDVTLTGQSQHGVTLISHVAPTQRRVPFAVITAAGVHHALLRKMTITSAWHGHYSANPTHNNPDAGGPDYAIITGKDTHRQMSYQLLIQFVTVEKFRKAGIKVGAGSHDVWIDHCQAHLATDVGGGGAGYGFLFQGRPSSLNPKPTRNPNLNTVNDNFHNRLMNSNASGPYLRHGALLQYYAHNNLIKNNHFSDTAYGAIDLHGEQEYANEITNNLVEHVSQTATHHHFSHGGGGIELGNSGGKSHSASGANNWIHHNWIVDAKYGVKIEYGTTTTLVEHNDISGNHQQKSGAGIYLGHTRLALILANRIHDNTAPSYHGIRLTSNIAMHDQPAGSPADCLISDNQIVRNPRGMAIRIDREMGHNRIQHNQFTGNHRNTIWRSTP